jgi:hypothetical protein
MGSMDQSKYLLCHLHRVSLFTNIEQAIVEVDFKQLSSEVCGGDLDIF